jgi:hypothetical protein
MDAQSKHTSSTDNKNNQDTVQELQLATATVLFESVTLPKSDI